MTREQRERAHEQVIDIQGRIIRLRNYCRNDDDLHDMVSAQVDDWAAIENRVMRYERRAGAGRQLAGVID